MKSEKAAEVVKCCTILHNFVTKEDDVEILEITEQQGDLNLEDSDAQLKMDHAEMKDVSN
uniref:DDE Tnp4 domain-containing protein n=1 Tax=Romanomermis culicivorax TaxID=13658 RepID=A0A915J6I4_ROMCU